LKSAKFNQSFTVIFYFGMSAADVFPIRFHGARFVSILRRISVSLGLILPFVAALALAAPAAHASTATGKTHHKSSKAHHAASSGHNGKSHHTAQNHSTHKKPTSTG
jgi:hypothetical protein